MKLRTWWRAVQYFVCYGTIEMWKAKKLMLYAAWFAAKVAARKDAKRKEQAWVQRMANSEKVMLLITDF